MVVEKEDLGLSLSLSLPEKRSRGSLQLNLMPSLTSSPCPQLNLLQKNSWNQTIHAPSSDPRNSEAFRVETRSFLKGTDMNRLPSTADAEEEAGVSSPNSTLSSISWNKRSEREVCGEDQDIERMSDEEDGEASRKKLRLSQEQTAILEESFKEHNTLNPKQKFALAKRLELRPRQIEVWFQNRRARTKLKQTEVDCEFLRRCCENLTAENRRLQKEVQELRLLKLSPQFYMQMAPPTTLIMCPSCERFAVSSSAPSTTSVGPRAQQLVCIHPRPVSFNPCACTCTTAV